MRRVWVWLRAALDPRWPALPDDIHQSIDEQTQARSRWIHDHVKHHPPGPCGFDGCGGHP